MAAVAAVAAVFRKQIKHKKHIWAGGVKLSSKATELVSDLFLQQFLIHCHCLHLVCVLLPVVSHLVAEKSKENK